MIHEKDILYAVGSNADDFILYAMVRNCSSICKIYLLVLRSCFQHKSSTGHLCGDCIDSVGDARWKE